MSDSDAIERLVDHVLATGFSAITPTAVQAAKVFLLDTLGVAIAGSNGPFVSELQETAAAWGRGSDCAIWGSSRRLPAPSAAMINAYQAHNSEYDAIHEAAVIHPLASILACLFAELERGRRLSGRELLTAIVLGVDTSCSIGMAATETLKFFRPATGGGFGAVAALAKAAGFDRDRMRAAFGIYLGQIGGTMQAHEEGSPLLGMQLGFCTRAALTAIDLAAAGVPGPHKVLEGNYGYFALFEGGADIDAGFAGLGGTWRVEGISHKPFPSGRATHGVIDGLLMLRAERGFESGDVESVTAEVPPLVYQLTGRPMIPEPGVNYARLCIPYVGAVALRRGDVTLDDFQPRNLSDPAVFELAQRFDVMIRDTGDPNALIPQRVSVATKSGERFTAEVDAVIGSPAKPLSRERHLAKFRRNWISGAQPMAVARGEELIALVDALEEHEDCRAMAALLSSDV